MSSKSLERTRPAGLPVTPNELPQRRFLPDVPIQYPLVFSMSHGPLAHPRSMCHVSMSWCARNGTAFIQAKQERQRSRPTRPFSDIRGRHTHTAEFLHSPELPQNIPFKEKKQKEHEGNTVPPACAPRYQYAFHKGNNCIGGKDCEKSMW